MSDAPLLALEGVSKIYRRGLFDRTPAFRLNVDFRIEAPGIIGVMGPNGAGKTTLFEMIAGSNVPTEGRVMVAGHDMQRVRYSERDRLAIHYHQSYQVRRFSRTKPAFLMEPAGSAYPVVHLFDEPSQGLAPKIVDDVMSVVRRLKREGIASIVVEQNAELALSVADRVVVLSHGTVAWTGDASVLAADPALKRTLLGGAQ